MDDTQTIDTNKVTEKYRKALDLSYRAFANEINRQLINTNVSYSNVRRWEKNHYEPELNLLFECIATYPQSWIAHWAVENICAMYPDLVQSGVVTFKLPDKNQ